MTNKKNLNGILYMLAFSSIFILLGIVFGGVNRVIAVSGWIFWVHQLLVGAGAIGMVLAFMQTWKLRQQFPLLSRLLTIGLVAMMFQIVLGQMLVNFNSSGWWVGVHFSLSLVILAASTGAAVYAFGVINSNKQQVRIRFISKFSKQTVLAVNLVILVLVSGVVVAGSSARYGCQGWPLCDGQVFPSTINGWVVYIHRLVVGALGIYLVWFNHRAWRTQRTQRAILTLANMFVVLYFAQGYVGALKAVRTFPPHMLALHEATAAALIVVASALVVVVGMSMRTTEEEMAEALIPVDRKQRGKDFLALNKPVVVSLLLSTTFAGMVIGSGEFPPLNTVFWTLLGGALAAGGSSAINQYIDRDLDQLMVRTSKRPIPSGRMLPAEGLAFGVTALLVSFYILAGFVNMLAALLSLAGMVYYVVLYSILLKKRSDQNIVIGGGAGAIPPLVGWAAATGSLNLTAGFLFLIIFLWTPPHFWALALTRKNEYANAGVPMLPVQRGEDETRLQIYIYTVVLVATTLLMWVLELVGWVYLVGAVVLGAYLLYLAWKVWKAGRNKVYYRMYKHSNYYLLLLFMILAIDAVVV